MSRNIFGWSYPPGAADDPYAPYNQTDEVIDLTDALMARGRQQHGLCGKDADLDYGGQLRVESCFLMTDTLEAHVHAYASIVPAARGHDGAREHAVPEAESEAEYDAYLDCCTEIVMGCGYPGEWDGDYWVMTHDAHVRIPAPEWDDAKSEDANRAHAVDLIYAAIFADPGIVAFQAEMTACAKAMERN